MAEASGLAGVRQYGFELPKTFDHPMAAPFSALFGISVHQSAEITLGAAAAGRVNLTRNRKRQCPYAGAS